MKKLLSIAALSVVVFGATSSQAGIFRPRPIIVTPGYPVPVYPTPIIVRPPVVFPPVIVPVPVYPTPIYPTPIFPGYPFAR